MSGRNFVIAGAAGLLADRIARIAARGGANVVSATAGARCSADAEVWYFADSATVRPAEFADARSFNLVITPYCGHDGWEWLRAADAEQPAAGRDVGSDVGIGATRVFTTSLIIDADGRSRDGFQHLLGALFDLKTEIDERVEEYFEHRALRVYAPADARVNLIDADRAAELMLAIAARAESGHFTIASPVSEPLADVLERAGNALGISLLLADERDPLTAIDELLAIRLGDFGPFLTSPSRAPVEDACAIGGIAPDSLIVDEDAQTARFDAYFDARSKERQGFLARTAAFPAAMRRMELDRGDTRLIYYAAGSGPHTIVLLNAFGQALDFWARLIERRPDRWRVLIADTSDLAATRGRGIPDFAGDIEAMLASEGAETCHLVAWCTGPRIAVEYALRHPDRVRSMVFLNTTLRCAGGPPELCSAFENNFDVLMRMLDQRPAMAASMMASLKSSAGSDDGIEELLADPDEEVATRVLARINASLRGAVAAPFASVESFLQFTRGVDTFWSYDIREKASSVRTPVLFLSAEHDRVAVPAGSKLAAELFPHARLIHVPGATHYFLYDRPEATSALIDAFIDDSGAPAEPVYSFATQQQQAVIP